MAQQITIDIVAETKKLTSGINDANDQLGSMSKGLKTAASAAAGLASAFVLKQGVTFLEQGIKEAKDARTAMLAAEAAFGKGSDALKKITDDANKFGKELGMDNDDVLKLATGLGARLPQSAKASSAELVLLAKNLEASSSGAIAAETTLSKLGKAFADGVITAKELQKTIPGLDSATYAMAETMSKAGKNQDALNLLIEAGKKKYGDAAAAQVTATQRFDVALADLKETIGTKVLPFVEKLINLATDMIDAFGAQPKILQNVELALLAIVAVGGPLLGFLASAKTAMVTLGLVSEGASVGIGLVRIALAGLGIGLAIAAIVLLIQNWDDVKKAADALWKKIQEVWDAIIGKIKEVSSAIINWLKENWPTILAILSGPFGLFLLFLAKHKDDLINSFTNMWSDIKELIGKFVDLISSGAQIAFLKMAVAVVETATAIQKGIVEKFTQLKDGAIDQFNRLKDAAGRIWDSISGFIRDVATNIKAKLDTVFTDMIEVGKDIARGIWQGLTSMTGWFNLLLKGWVNSNIPLAVRKILGIASPSKVMAKIGEYAVEGLYQGMGVKGPIGIQMPQINVGGGAGVAPINITINAGVGTDPYALGRAVQTSISNYSRISGNAVFA
jgi:hypothetical protein